MSFLLSDNLCSSFQNVIVRPGTDMMLKVVCADNMFIRLTRLQYPDKSFCATFLLRHHVQLASDRIYRVIPPPLSGNLSLIGPALQRSDFKTKQNRKFFIYIRIENIYKSKISLFGCRWPFQTINTNNDSVVVRV